MVRYSFPVGLLHPRLYAGSSRRTYRPEFPLNLPAASFAASSNTNLDRSLTYPQIPATRHLF